MLCYIFGGVKESIVHLSEPTKAAGLLELERGRVRWFLSLDRNDLPTKPKPGEPMTYRSITVNDNEIEFSSGFNDLHTKSYKRILAGNGFAPEVVKPSIQIVSDIRNAQPIGLKGDYHPLLESIK